MMRLAPKDTASRVLDSLATTLMGGPINDFQQIRGGYGG